MNLLPDITIGQYLPLESRIHQLDPRLKIFLTSGLLVLIFLLNNFIGYGLLGFFLIGIIFIAQLPYRYILRSLKSMRWLFLFIFILNLIWTPGRSLPHFPISFINVTYEGLRQAGFITLRLVLLILATSLLTLTTSPLELTGGLEKILGFPRIAKIPAHEFAMMMTIALRFIPTLLDETGKIMKAQIARGADFESGNLIRRARSLIPLLIPLFMSVFRRAEDLATAMEARCYRGGKNRSHFRELQFKKGDYVSAVIFAIIFIGLVWFFRFRH
jgi:energy-coupling factor transport system permease protein